MLGELSPFSRKTHLDNTISYAETIIQMKKTKKSKSKSKIDVFALFVKEINEKTPITQHSGKGVVSDKTVARIQDIYRGEKKDA
jgi:hypothetical protein